MSNAELLKSLFGVDSVPDDMQQGDLPPLVAGRVLHIDGDFLAYQVTADESKSFDDMKHNHDVAAETLRLLAGAEKVVSHLTASDSDKGGRYEIAIQKQYQVGRIGKEKPEFLNHMRDWMENERGAIMHHDQEADDGLCQALYDAESPELAVLVSKDKDLRMCKGLHLDWDEGTLEMVNGFGYIELDRSGSSAKIKGKGTKFFWAQMLMGDTADDIAGLPKVPGWLLNKVKPTKAITKALDVIDNPKSTTDKVLKAQKTLDDRKPGACGPVITYDILKDVHSDREALQLITTLYKDYGTNIGFKHWETGEDATWQDVFTSEAKLLWMRRVKDEDDVKQFFKEVLCST